VDKLREKVVTESTWDRGQGEGKRKMNLRTHCGNFEKICQEEKILSNASVDTNAERNK
jgi:hypothetical protein